MPTMIAGLRQQISYCIERKEFDEACEASILLGKALIKDGKQMEAYYVFDNAKKYVANLLHEARRKWEYKIDRGRVEAGCHVAVKRNIRYSLDEFLTKYAQENTNLKIQQDVMFFAADISYDHLSDIQTAYEYATKSLEYLEMFDAKNNDDFKLRKWSVYHLLAKIYLDQDELDKAKEKCDEALTCNSIVYDPPLHFVLWDIKRKCLISKSERLQCSLKMYEIYESSLKSSKKDKCDVFICLGEDYIAVKDFENAEKCYAEIFFDKECCKFDEKHVAKSCLIYLYKVEKLIERFREYVAGEVVDPQMVARMYEKIGDLACAGLWAYEFAIENYTNMLEIARGLDDSMQPEKFDLFNASLFSLAGSYADLKDFEAAVQCCDEFYSIAMAQQADEEILVPIALEKVVHVVKCSGYSFDEKEDALLNLRPRLSTNIQFEHFFSTYVSLLKMYGKKINRAKESIVILQRKWKQYKNATDESQYVQETTSSSLNEEDTVSDEEILKYVETRWKYWKKLQALKKQKTRRNAAGESELHLAVKKRSNNLRRAMLLMEECEYEDIIDEQDNVGMTPLFYSLFYEKFEVAEYYVRKGSNPNIATTEKFFTQQNLEVPAGQTPLMIACVYGNIPMVELLIQKGANPLLKDANDKSAADYLVEFQQAQDLSIEQSAKIDELVKDWKDHESQGYIEDPFVAAADDVAEFYVGYDSVNMNDEGFEEASDTFIGSSNNGGESFSDGAMSADIYDYDNATEDNENVESHRKRGSSDSCTDGNENPIKKQKVQELQESPSDNDDDDSDDSIIFVFDTADSNLQNNFSSF